MPSYDFNFTEVNQGFASIEADTIEEAEKLASEMYYAGEVVWKDTDVSYAPEKTLRYADVGIQWIDEKPERTFSALVAIGNWAEDDEDERVFFYFADEAEFERAKLPEGMDGFRIITEWERA